MAEAPTSSKKEQTKSSQSEKKVEKVLSTAELLPASKELMAEVEAWDHEDNAEADIFAMAEVDCLAKKLASAACCDKDKSVQEKKEQYKEVPLMQVEGVYGMKGEAETMVDRMHSTLKEEQGLKEEKVTRGKKEWHEISPLVADKLLPPDREGSWAVGGVRG